MVSIALTDCYQGEDVYVINGRKISFEATLLKGGKSGRICVRPDHRTTHEFGLTRADQVQRDGEGRREFSAVVFSLGQKQNKGDRIHLLNTTKTGLVVNLITEDGLEQNIPALTTEQGKWVRRTFRDTDRISDEEEREEWLRWLLPNTSSG